jgi:two-component system response regulator FixJ
MNPEATVFVVDDDPSVRRALRRLIDSVELHVETYASAEGFLNAYDPARPGCLVLDVRMPGVSGLDLQETLAGRDVLLPVIFITGYGDVPTTVRAMKGGAVDFIEKPFNEQLLLDAVHRGIEQDARLRRERAERADVLRRVAQLTPRERQVLTRVVAGRMNKQIAAELGTSEKTVKTHRARVMSKMQADSVAELVVLAQMAGLCTTKVPTG